MTQPEIVSRAERIRHDVRRKRFRYRACETVRRITRTVLSGLPGRYG